MNNKIIKIGNVELYENDALSLYENKKYIVTYSKIYQLHYSQAQKVVYGSIVYEQSRLMKRGHFMTLSASEVNNLLGFKLLSDV